MKSAIFIDGAYLAKLSSQDKRWDFKKLIDKLTEGTYRLRTYYYNCLPFVDHPSKPDQTELFTRMKSFFDALSKIPRFQVKLGRLQRIGDEFTQKGVDMKLGVDLVQLSLSGQIDKAIILASDSDFAYAIEKARDSGVVIVLAHFSESTVNEDLLKTIDEEILLDDLASECTWKK
ncbi:MAG: NYN domain-containing protein [Thaumarchaeota archaeon]|nr:NYN domain-containing protein [Nitrososphaerota archaeon]